MIKNLLRAYRYGKLLEDAQYDLPKEHLVNSMCGQVDIQKLTLWYKTEIANLNQSLDHLEAMHKIKCTCKEGCGYCCQQAIYIGPHEYEILSYTLAQFHKKDQGKNKN